MKIRILKILLILSSIGLINHVLIAQITVDSAGNVGVGTTAPAFKLHVVDPSHQVSFGVGEPVGSPSDLAGYRIAAWSDGNIYVDSKMGSGGKIVYRYGEGTQNGATNTWMTVQNGKVGIGTNNPSGKLTVSGTGGSVSQNGIEWFTKNNTSGYDAWIGRIYSDVPTGSWGTAPFVFSVPNTSGAEVKTLVLLNGNVGIGTTSPSSKLHVLGNTNREVARFQGSTDVSNNRNFVSIYTTNPGYWWEFSNQDPNGGGTLNGLAFSERSGVGSSVERVYFASGGNVGIGTVAPSHKLEVAGDVRAASFIANSNTYADFVFEPDYDLPSLSSVKAHIEEHGHLPDIPSEAEAMEHGINLATMQVRLLQKIEELTLHQIAQEERLNGQAERIGQLETENQTLRATIQF